MSNYPVGTRLLLLVAARFDVSIDRMFGYWLLRICVRGLDRVSGMRDRSPR